jgi:hypothetical protein
MTTRTTWSVPGRLHLAPAPGVQWTALRISSVLLAGLSLLWSLDRLEWSLYVTFGAFATVYGGAAPSPRRWRLQAALGAVLTCAVATGAAAGVSADRRWVAVPLAAAWAAAAAAASDRFAWRPPGPMFPVFAVATCASIPTAPATVPAAVAVTATTAAASVLLGAVEVAVRRPAGGASPGGPPRHSLRRQRVHAVRCGVAVLVAGSVATSCGISHPYWAMVAAVVPLTAADLRAQVVRGVHRAAGTALGVLVAACLLVAPLPTFALLLVVVLLQAAAELMVVRHYGAALVLITPLALLSADLAHPQPVGQVVGARLLETLLGVAVGVVVAVLTRDRAGGPGSVRAG